MAAGPVLALPVPVGGRLPVEGVAAGEVMGVLEADAADEATLVGVGFVVAVAWMGPVATPATVLVRSPETLPVCVALSSA